MKTLSGRPSSAAVAVLLLVGALVAPVLASRAAAATAPGCTDARFHPVAPIRVYDSADPGDARVGQTPVTVDLYVNQGTARMIVDAAG